MQTSKWVHLPQGLGVKIKKYLKPPPRKCQETSTKTTEWNEAAMKWELPWFAYLITTVVPVLNRYFLFVDIMQFPNGVFFMPRKYSDHAIFMPLSIKSLGG